MNRMSHDMTWIHKQLRNYGLTSRQRGDAGAMTQSVTHIIDYLTNNALTEKQAQEVLTLTSELIAQHAIASQKGEKVTTDQWKQLYLGSVSIGSPCRVKTDAYTGRFAEHNGKTGTLIGSRNGLAIVRYDNTDEEDVSHEPEKLETPVTP